MLSRSSWGRRRKLPHNRKTRWRAYPRKMHVPGPRPLYRLSQSDRNKPSARRNGDGMNFVYGAQLADRVAEMKFNGASGNA